VRDSADETLDIGEDTGTPLIRDWLLPEANVFIRRKVISSEWLRGSNPMSTLEASSPHKCPFIWVWNHANVYADHQKRKPIRFQ
jgi:hypothetical protein